MIETGKPMIKTVIRLENDVVMVFNVNGEQIQAYQGQYEEMKEKILKDAPPKAVFANWFDLSKDPQMLSRETW